MYLNAYISRACTEASGQLMYYSLKFWLWINYLSHILSEPGTVSHLMFELFKISGVSNFLFFLNEPMYRSVLLVSLHNI